MSTQMKSSPDRKTHFSFVAEYPPAAAEAAHAHFVAKLSVETDPWDVKEDLDRGANIVVVDARSAEAYGQCRIPGALSLPHRTIDEVTTAAIPGDAIVVTYCWGPACNAATKAAARLAGLGFQVKEMIGGLEYWRHEGHPVEGTLGEAAPLHG